MTVRKEVPRYNRRIIIWLTLRGQVDELDDRASLADFNVSNFALVQRLVRYFDGTHSQIRLGCISIVPQLRSEK